MNLRKPTKMTIESCLKSAMKDSLNSHLKVQIHTNSLNLWFLPEGPSGREKKRRVLRTTLGKCRGCKVIGFPWGLCLIGRAPEQQPWKKTVLLCNSHVYYQLKEMTTALWTLENLLKWQLWFASKAQWKILWIRIWKCKYTQTRRTCNSCWMWRLAERKRIECFALS